MSRHPCSPAQPGGGYPGTEAKRCSFTSHMPPPSALESDEVRTSGIQVPHGTAGSCLGCAWPQPREPLVYPSLCPGWSRFTLAQSFQLLQSPPPSKGKTKQTHPGALTSTHLCPWGTSSPRAEGCSSHVPVFALGGGKDTCQGTGFQRTLHPYQRKVINNSH